MSGGTWQPAVGMRVISNGMLLDGLDNPGTIVGFVNVPKHPRHGQPIVEWDRQDKLFGVTTPKCGAVHPVFLWPLDYALALAEQAKAGKPLP